MIILSLICLVTLILFIAFETEAITEYGRALHLPLPNFKEYLQIRESGGSVHYLKYLRTYHQNSFIYSLITCAICSSVFISLFVSLIFSVIIFFPLIEVGGLSLYFILKIFVKYSS